MKDGNNMKKFFVVIFSLLIILSTVISVYADNASVQNPPVDAIAVAENKLETVKSIFSSDYDMWGFSSVEEVQSLVLGEGKRVLYPDETKIHSSNGNSVFDYINDDKEIWIFTLNSSSISKGFIWIIKENNDYTLARYSGPDEVYNQLKLTAEKIAEENGLTISPVFFNTFGTNNFILQGNGEEYILPIETYAMEMQSSEYSLNRVVLSNKNGYLLNSNDFTNGLKSMYNNDNVPTNVTDYKYSGASIYNHIPVNNEPNYMSMVIALFVISATLIGIVIVAVIRRQKYR